jgi:5-methylcytosine-specific restriction endonuclease McrA
MFTVPDSARVTRHCPETGPGRPPYWPGMRPCHACTRAGFRQCYCIKTSWRLPRGSEEQKQARRQEWIAEFGHDKCVYCGVRLAFPCEGMKVRGAKGFRPDPLEAQRDHAIPRSRLRCHGYSWEQPCGAPECTKGCMGETSNIVPACRTCNIRKGARTPAEFRALLLAQKQT